MAMVTCPSCKKIVNDSSGKCPNCGKPLKSGAADTSTPAGKLRMASSVLITVSFVLFMVELFDVAKTYVGGLLLGVGIFLHGVSQSKIADKEDYIGKRKVMIIYVAGVVLFLGGIFFLIMDLR